MLIVVDQFEELYTLTPDEGARRRFLDELLATTSCAGSKVNITLTLRGDFVGKALAYRPLSDRLQDAQINLGPMTREELECVIRNPAEKIQLEFEAGLVRRILNDVGEEPGNLPLLEFVLKELWDKRRGQILLNEIYDGIGGLHGAVATKADELLNGLSSGEQKILQRIFLRIVRPSAESGLDTRRRAAFTELPPEGNDLVVKLTKERLLVTNQPASGLEPTVEVAHEALISNWSTLRAWVNQDREFLLWRERLGTLLTEWERVQQSDEALLRGQLLTEAKKWFDQRSQDLSDGERKFFAASRELRERLEREAKERQKREIEDAQKLARAEAARAEEAEQREKEQKEAARKLRRRAWIATGLGVVACVFGVVACVMMLKSESYRLLAEQRAQSAEERARSAEEQARIAKADENARTFLKKATKDHPWVNSLGMKFVPVADTEVLFSVWDTRVQDFEAFVAETNMSSFGKDGWQQRGAAWPGFSQGPTHPVVGVSWYDAKKFCEWLTRREQGSGMLPRGRVYRLPTDAEWRPVWGCKVRKELIRKRRMVRSSSIRGARSGRRRRVQGTTPERKQR